jgi:hypothetical protein
MRVAVAVEEAVLAVKKSAELLVFFDKNTITFCIPI